VSDDADLHLLFPTVVRVSELDDHERINASLRAEIAAVRQTAPNSKPQSWACELYTTIGNPDLLLRRPAVAGFLRAAEQQAKAYARTLNLDIDRHPLSITECWLNVYGSGHSQEIHLHRNSVISGIYYVQAPPGSGATLFYSPLAEVMLEPPSTTSSKLNAKVTAFPPIEGRMILFRSAVRHSVLPSRIDGERITIAFNAIM
jgi:uncharacterized protein (TIGR02466 family)